MKLSLDLSEIESLAHVDNIQQKVELLKLIYLTSIYMHLYAYTHICKVYVNIHMDIHISYYLPDSVTGIRDTKTTNT